VLVDVRIDYSKRTRFTEGIVKTNSSASTCRPRRGWSARALWRRVTG